MKITRNTYLFLIGIGIGTTLSSCDADDVCVDDGDSPKLTIQMRYPNSTTELFDTISFRKYEADGTLGSDSMVFSNVSKFSMPVVLSEDKALKFRVRYGNDRNIIETVNGVPTIVEVIKSKTDDISLSYESIGDSYTSKACGFGIYFQNITLTTTNNWILKSETVNKDIKDGSTTNLIVYADPRF